MLPMNGSTAPKPAAVVERTLSRALRLFAKGEPGEAIGASLLTLTVFLRLTGYCLLQTVREPVLFLHGGAEVKPYARAGKARLLVVVLS